MPIAKRYNTQSLFFSDRLTAVLKQIPDYPLTVIEAPMGYGKTTAVKEYAAKTGADVLWQTVYDNTAAHFWSDYCKLFTEMDGTSALCLAELGLPEDSAARREAVSIIAGVKLRGTTILVIDDYHLVSRPDIHDFILYLVKNELPNLHIVLTTRMASLEALDELLLKGLAQHITQKLLELTPAEIARYYKNCGVRLKQEEAAALYTYTEGWISALYLCLLGFLQDGQLEKPVSLQELIEKNVYRPLAGDLKEFLLRICLFDRFTLPQAEAMWHQDNAAGLLRQLMDQNAFIQYASRNQTYQIHNIFTAFLREIFAGQQEKNRREIWRAAGEWHLQAGDNLTAMEAFYQAGDFDSLLAAVELDKGNSFNGVSAETFMRYFTECPDEIKQSHPLAGVIYAREQMFGDREQFSLHCRNMEKHIAQIADNHTKNRIAGEMELVYMFTKYNDITAMSGHIRKAYELLQGPSGLNDHKTSWTLGSPSVLYMFYRQNGALQQETDDLYSNIPLYCQITGGHGLGAEYTMLAEQHYYSGDFENAEIVSHKALQTAKGGQQISIVICALFLQVRLALARGDLAVMQKLMDEMRTEIRKGGQKLYLHTVSLCEGFVYAHLKQPEHISEWIRTGDFAASHLLITVMAYFHIIYGRLLLATGEERKLLGMADHFMDIAAIFPNVLGQIYTHIYVAAANEKLLRRNAALTALRQALELALPDKVVMPFVENADIIQDLLEELNRGSVYREETAKILSLSTVYRQAIAKMNEPISQAAAKPDLAEREREIALLVVDGQTNKEIAVALCISENTVKTQLKRIFEKFGVNSRALLKEYLEK